MPDHLPLFGPPAFCLPCAGAPRGGMPAPGAARPLVERLVGSPAVRAGYTSAVVHILLLTLLAILWLDAPERARPRPLLLAFDATPEPTAGAAGFGVGVTVKAPPTPPEPPAPASVVTPSVVTPSVVTPSVVTPSVVTPSAMIPVLPVARRDVEPAATDGAAPADPPAQTPVAEAAPPPAAAPVVNSAARVRGGDAFATRRGPGRGKALLAHGGSAASEAAVERGLAWLALHQAADGSWRFDLSGCRCDGSCSQPGTIGSTTAATGLALLPFLGAGSTHVEGRYQETVARGLYALLGRMRPTPRGGDLCEGTMYGHGVATLALAEAYGMTRDELLARPLADAVRFIVAAQDAYGGGWRYLPGQAGDTTVTAWQLAALKSAALAGIEVPSPTIDGIRRFLDRVQSRNGEAYGYLGNQAQPCTSAIGLFCRLHTAWDDQDRLARGLAALARPGPSPQAVYLNFYLAQALLQAEHASWPRWNARNRDHLVAGQAGFGHEQGSWSFADRETAPGGRLAHTALALLTLEVYYRVLPLYRPEAVERGF